MNFQFKKNLSYLTLLLICAWYLVISFKNSPNNPISYDVYGYYLYLPASLKYDDPYLRDRDWIQETNEKYHNTPYLYQIWPQPETDKFVIRYPMGFAFLFFPHFIIADMLASPLGYPADGFSKPYQWAIFIGHLLYVVLGLIMFRKVLRLFFSEQISALILLLLFLGTNFYFTSIFMVGMAHGYLFLFYSLILWFTCKWHEKPNWQNSIFLGCSLGIATLSRASEVVAVLIPLLWNVYNKQSLQSKWQFLKSNSKFFFIVLGVYISWGLPQLFYYKIMTGHFFIDSYNNPGEGFDLLSPHTLDFLFSFRKGWFLYTPLMLVAVFATFYLWKTNKKIALAFTVLTILNIYLLSSWTCWWYAESFGQRAVVQSYPVYLIGLGFLINYIQHKRVLIVAFLGVSLLFVGLNMFQSWQAKNGLIHLSLTTKESYIAHFLKTEPVANYAELLLIDTSVPPKEYLDRGDFYIHKEINFQFQENEGLLVGDFDTALEGENCIELDTINEFVWNYYMKFQDLAPDNQIILEWNINYKILDFEEGETLPMLAIKILHQREVYKEFYTDLLMNSGKGEWQEVQMYSHIPTIRKMDDEIQLHFWNPSRVHSCVRAVQLRVWRKRSE